MMKKLGKKLRKLTPTQIQGPGSAQNIPFVSISDGYGHPRYSDHFGVRFGSDIPILLKMDSHLVSHQDKVISGCGNLSLPRVWWGHLPEAVKARVRSLGLEAFILSLPESTPHTTHAVITALCERWLCTTHTFHLPIGEFTVTPSDFAGITGFGFGGTPIRFNCFLSRQQLVNDYTSQLIGYTPENGKVLCSRVERYWAACPNPSEEDVERYTRAYVLVLLSCTFFPTGQSTCNMTLLPTLVDLTAFTTLDWARAGLGQLYYALDLCARGRQQEILGFWFGLLIWVFERGILGAPALKDVRGKERSTVLRTWTQGWQGIGRDLVEIRQGLRDVSLERLDHSPWLSHGIQPPVVQASLRFDDRRFVMECPMSQEWYLGERLRLSDHVDGPAGRLIPPPLPRTLFWPHLSEPAEHPDIYKAGYIVDSIKGDYRAFIRESLLPVRLGALAAPSRQVKRRRGSSSAQQSTPEDEDTEATTLGGFAPTQDRRHPVHSSSAATSTSQVAGVVEGRLVTQLRTSFSLIGLDGRDTTRELPPYQDHQVIFAPEHTTHIPRAQVQEMAQQYLGMESFMTRENTALVTRVQMLQEQAMQVAASEARALAATNELTRVRADYQAQLDRLQADYDAYRVLHPSESESSEEGNES